MISYCLQRKHQKTPAYYKRALHDFLIYLLYQFQQSSRHPVNSFR